MVLFGRLCGGLSAGPGLQQRRARPGHRGGEPVRRAARPRPLLAHRPVRPGERDKARPAHARSGGGRAGGAAFVPVPWRGELSGIRRLHPFRHRGQLPLSQTLFRRGAPRPPAGLRLCARDGFAGLCAGVAAARRGDRAQFGARGADRGARDLCGAARGLPRLPAPAPGGRRPKRDTGGEGRVSAGLHPEESPLLRDAVRHDPAVLRAQHRLQLPHQHYPQRRRRHRDDGPAERLHGRGRDPGHVPVFRPFRAAQQCRAPARILRLFFAQDARRDARAERAAPGRGLPAAGAVLRALRRRDRALCGPDHPLRGLGQGAESRLHDDDARRRARERDQRAPV